MMPTKTEKAVMLVAAAIAAGMLIVIAISNVFVVKECQNSNSRLAMDFLLSECR